MKENLKINLTRMKNYLPLYFFLIVYILLGSCQKDGKNEEKRLNNVKYPLTISLLKNFEQSIEKMNINKSNSVHSVSADSLSSYLGIINCWVFMNNGTSESFYHSIKQDSTSPDFGIIKDSLPYGNYKIYLGAVAKPINSYNASNRNLPSFSHSEKGPFFKFFNFIGGLTSETASYNADFFASNAIDLKIDGSESNSQLSVDMSRIPGLLELHINDEASTPGVKLTPGITTVADAYYFNGDSATSAGLVPSGPSLVDNFAYMAKISDGVYKFFQYWTDKPFSIVIISSLGTKKTIQNIVCRRNQKTIVTGNFFNDPGPGSNSPSFRMKIDTAWVALPIEIQY